MYSWLKPIISKWVLVHFSTEKLKALVKTHNCIVPHHCSMRWWMTIMIFKCNWRWLLMLIWEIKNRENCETVLEQWERERESQTKKGYLHISLCSCSGWRGLRHPGGPCRSSYPRICVPAPQIIRKIRVNEIADSAVDKSITPVCTLMKKERKKNTWYVTFPA